MPQLSLYLNDEVYAQLQAMADAGGVSLSKCACESIRRAACTEWPPGYEALFGSIEDESFNPPIRIISRPK